MLHEAWHVLVLVLVLAGAASALLLVLHALIPDFQVVDRRRAKPFLGGIVGLAVALLVIEWLRVH